MIKIGNNVIVNTDDSNDVASAHDLKHIVLTCGLKLNSTVTASSINDDGFTFCLQRAVFSLSHKRISPQEFNVHWSTKPDDMFIPLAFVTALILCDVDPKVFETIRF